MKEYLSTKEAAALIINTHTGKRGISIAGVQQLIQRGVLPAKKWGRDWMIKPEDIDKIQNRSLGRPRKEDSE